MIRLCAEYFRDMGYRQHHEEPLQIPLPSFGGGGSTICPVRPDSADLKWHHDQRGSVAEVFRRSWEVDCDQVHAEAHGMIRQAYISTTLPGVVKGWHLHMKQTDRFVCVRGRIVLNLCSLMTTSPKVVQFVLDAERGPRLVTVPPGIAHGWKAIGTQESWVLNLCSQEYDGTDEWRRPAHSGPADDVSFNWKKEIGG